MGVIQRLPDDVVNRIAAGEVVVRPANAVKELIENSLDAGSTEIVVTIRDGGLSLLQVQDNGKGIRKDDLDIVCERFTTSKLTKFEDLQSMRTYGFRGEALASLSHVAKVTITSKPADQVCAYQGKYIDSKPTSIRMSAGLDGTCVSAEDLFYNCISRRRVFKHHAEETARIADVVTRYAVNRPDVSFAMRRGGSGTDFRTNGQGDRNVTVAALLGKECAEDVIDVSHSSQLLQYSIAGMLTKPLSSVTARSVQIKKNRQKSFFLFINGRSVQCAPLKFAVDTIFADRDLVCPFVLLSLQIEPSRIDVNVHPTKESVMFLEQDHIVEDVQKHFESLLHDIFDREIAPRSINEICGGSQQLLTDSQIERIPSQAQIHFERINSNSRDSSQSSSLKSDKKRVDHMLVRTDTQERRLDEFLVQKESVSLENVEIVAVSSSQLDNVQYEERDESCRRLFSFTSLDKLRRSICTNASQSLRELFKSHTFVGCVSPESILIQYSTALYLINAKEVLREMFYQNFVFSFGNFGSYKLSNGGASVAELYIIANNEDGNILSEGAQNASFVLDQHGAMLDDYFSLRFERQSGDVTNTSMEFETDSGIKIDSLNIVSIPSLIDGYVPQLEGLPRLISDLVNTINWDDELLCFSGICRALAEFFVIKEEYCSGESLSGLQEKSIHWKRVLSDLLIPRIKTRFMPLENFKQKEVIKRLADLHDLYKVFERC